MAKKVDKNEQPLELNQPPVDSDLKFLDVDGNPTADEFTETPDTVTGKTIRTRNRVRTEATHGTISSNPGALLDSAGVHREDSGPREIKSTQVSQAGEDPGRVFDSVGLHPQAGAQHTKALRGISGRDPNIVGRLHGEVPDRPTDTPGPPSDAQGATASDVPPPPPPSAPTQPSSGEPLIT